MKEEMNDREKWVIRKKGNEGEAKSAKQNIKKTNKDKSWKVLQRERERERERGLQGREIH